MRHSTLLALPALSLLAVAACGDPTSTGSARSVSVSFATTPPPSASVSMSLAGTAAPLVITRAQIVFSETELETADGACLTTGDDDDCPEIESGPVLVDLPLNGSTRSALTAMIPVGTYQEFEAEIDVVRSDDAEDRAAADAFLAANPQFRGVSIRVEGTYDGQPFVYTTDVEAELELEFSPPLAIAGDGGNITVMIDLAAWFKRADGSILDPRTANAGGVNKSLVDNNIEASFDAFEDHDRNGRDD